MLRSLVIAQTVVVVLLVMGWFLSTFVVNPTVVRVDRGRRERLEFQCRVEHRLDMEERSCGEQAGG